MLFETLKVASEHGLSRLSLNCIYALTIAATLK